MLREREHEIAISAGRTPRIIPELESVAAHLARVSGRFSVQSAREVDGG